MMAPMLLLVVLNHQVVSFLVFYFFHPFLLVGEQGAAPGTHTHTGVSGITLDQAVCATTLHMSFFVFFLPCFFVFASSPDGPKYVG